MAPGVSALVFTWYLGPDKNYVAESGQGLPEDLSNRNVLDLGERKSNRHHSSTPIMSGHANMVIALLGMSLTWFCSQGVRIICYF